MSKVRSAVLGVCAAVMVVGGIAHAQKPDKPKRPPHQTPDRGIDQPVPTGQEQPIGDRSLAGVRIAVRPDGSLIAHLDESFHDALVATRKADGTVGYACLHGLAAPVLEEQ